MRFIVENFGPIEKADIRIKDLNIFIGKNSTGKSYLAYLIWCFLAVEPDWNKLRELVDKYVSNELISEIIEKDRELHKKMEDNESIDFESYIKELNNLSDKVSRGVKGLIVEAFKRFDEIWGKNLEELIKDTFMVDDLKELIKFGKDSAKIIVCNNDCTMKIYSYIDENGLTIGIDERAIEIVQENLFVTAIPIPEGLILLTLEYSKDSKRQPYHEYIRENYQVVGVIPIVFSWVFDGYVPYHLTFIAPDGRCELMRSRETYLHTLLSDVVINEVNRKTM
jgi:hypothetical protein